MKDFIFRKKNVLSKEKCDKIISIFEKDKTKQKGALGTVRTIDENRKKCSEVYVDTGQSADDNAYNYLFIDELKSAVGDYKKEYPFIDTVFRWKLDNQYKIQRYYPNEGFFHLHCENYGPILVNNKLSATSARTLTWMIYLNDVTEGGYTEFPSQNKLFQPRTGDILIWPAFWTHPHRGITSKTQTKYIITGWHVHILREIVEDKESYAENKEFYA